VESEPSLGVFEARVGPFERFYLLCGVDKTVQLTVKFLGADRRDFFEFFVGVHEVLKRESLYFVNLLDELLSVHLHNIVKYEFRVIFGLQGVRSLSLVPCHRILEFSGKAKP